MEENIIGAQSETEPGTTAEALQLGFVEEPKQDSRARAWMLTIKAADHTKEEIIEKLSEYTGFIGQLEKGSKTGYLHWQVYVENENPIRFSALKAKFPTAHLGKRKTTAARCVAYCTKTDGTEMGVQISGGFIKVDVSQGQRTDLEELRAAIVAGTRYEELVLNDARAMRNFSSLKEMQNLVDAEKWGSVERPDIKAHFISGGTAVGKTSTIYAKHGQHWRTVHSVDDYRRSSNCWDQYSAQPVLLLDEFEGSWSLQWMRKLLDRYRLQLPARYANKFAAWSTVYVLSNEPYAAQWTAEDGSPSAHAAVRRRFTSIGEMQPDGSMIYERLNWVDLDEPVRLSYEEAFGIEKPEWIAERSEAKAKV